MEGVFLVEVSKKIKKHRTEMRLTVQELASRSGVTKGLISQIENGRSIPSLPVLFSIIQSLEIGMGPDLENSPVILRKHETYEPFQKEDAVGFFYRRIMVQTTPASTIDIVLLRLEPGATREPVETAAFEYKYIISGTVEYIINDTSYVLESGDSLFFDGRLRHNPSAIGNEPAVMLIVYFFEQK